MSNGATPPTLRVLARQPSSCASVAKLPGTPHSAGSTSIISGASSDISDISSFDGSINGEKRRSVRRAMPRLRLPASASQLRLSVPSWRKPGRGAAADADAEEAGGTTQPTVSTTQPTVSEGDESPTAGGRSDAEALRGEVILADEPEASAAGETTLGDAKAAVSDDAVAAEQEVELQEAELQEAVLEEAGAEPQPEEEAPGLSSTAHPTACGGGGARGGEQKREQKREQKCEQKCEQAVLAPPPKRADLLPEEKAPSPQPPALAPTPLARHAPARCRSSLVRSFCHAGQ